MSGPGDKDFDKMGLLNPMQSDSTSRSADSVLVRSKGGGGGGAAQKTLEERQQSNQPPEPPPETYEFPTEDSAATEDTVKIDPAVLSDAKWVQPDTLFHQDAEVTVQLTLPKEKEHVTKVQAELFANTPTGPKPISKGEAWAQSDGKAVITVPVFKPDGYVDGAVEYFFRIYHSLAKMLSGEKQSRQVSEMALKSADHVLVPGSAFDRESSFISPKGTKGLKPIEAKFNEWDKKYSKKAQIAVFGHTDKGEKDAKGLSERRAQSAYAFITNDAATWEKLYNVEKWGLKALQSILKDLGHYPWTVDGTDGPKTQDAFKAFRKSAGVPESGKEDAATRKALFTAYMKGKHDIKIDASRFCKVAGNPWMGCAGNNRAKESKETAPENCRVAFILIVPNKNFPVYFPCQDGNEGPCQAQCKKAGIGCLFYDELVREEKQVVATAPAHEEKHDENGDTLKNYSIEKAVAHLDANAHDKSQSSCARYVRLAIDAGGGKIKPPNPLSAKDYGPKLAEIGFRKIDTAGYIPQKGDLVVFQAPSTSSHGHIQMFNGTIWVSDFRQHDASDIYPGSRYREEKVSYEIYRP